MTVSSSPFRPMTSIAGNCLSLQYQDELFSIKWVLSPVRQ